MDLAPGDIVEFFGDTAGHKKYHLCVLECVAGNAAVFLFINSTPRFAGEFVVDCSELPFLPPSKTGKSVFSFSDTVRQNQRQLKLYRAKKRGALPQHLAVSLLAHAKAVRTLPSGDMRIVLAALEALATA